MILHNCKKIVAGVMLVALASSCGVQARVFRQPIKPVSATLVQRLKSNAGSFGHAIMQKVKAHPTVSAVVGGILCASLCVAAYEKYKNWRSARPVVQPEATDIENQLNQEEGSVNTQEELQPAEQSEEIQPSRLARAWELMKSAPSATFNGVKGGANAIVNRSTAVKNSAVKAYRYMRPEVQTVENSEAGTEQEGSVNEPANAQEEQNEARSIWASAKGYVAPIFTVANAKAAGNYIADTSKKTYSGTKNTFTAVRSWLNRKPEVQQENEELHEDQFEDLIPEVQSEATGNENSENQQDDLTDSNDTEVQSEGNVVQPTVDFRALVTDVNSSTWQELADKTLNKCADVAKNTYNSACNTAYALDRMRRTRSSGKVNATEMEELGRSRSNSAGSFFDIGTERAVDVASLKQSSSSLNDSFVDLGNDGQHVKLDNESSRLPKFTRAKISSQRKKPTTSRINVNTAPPAVNPRNAGFDFDQLA